MAEELDRCDDEFRPHGESACVHVCWREAGHGGEHECPCGQEWEIIEEAPGELKVPSLAEGQPKAGG